MNRPEPIELENNLGPDAVTGEINRVPWMAYDVDEMGLYIAEKDKEIAELKQKLEDVQASAYTESVDAGMRERMLKRALWLERARRASAWQIHFALSHNHSIKRKFTINGASSPHDRMVTMRTARDWAMIWENVERKCREKAEEYK